MDENFISLRIKYSEIYCPKKINRNRKKKTHVCINNLFFFVLRPYVPRGTKRIGEGDKLSQKSDQ